MRKLILLAIVLVMGCIEFIRILPDGVAYFRRRYLG